MRQNRVNIVEKENDMEQTKRTLSAKEFLTIYTGIYFDKETLANAIDKIVASENLSVSNMSVANAFRVYVDNHCPALAAVCKAIGPFKKNPTHTKEENQAALDQWVEHFTQIVGDEILVDGMLTGDRTCHAYALMAWHKQTYDQAYDFVINHTLAEINEQSYARASIGAACEGLRKYGRLDLSPSDVTPETYDKIILILAEIHDQWVRDSAEKYSRGDDRLFQHLPTALIGIEELSKDLMFLAPYLAFIGINAGKMELEPRGSFIPSQEIVDAYNRYVQKYVESGSLAHAPKNDPEMQAQALQRHIGLILTGTMTESCGNIEMDGYLPLDYTDKDLEALRIERLKYMLDHTRQLAERVLELNPYLIDQENASSSEDEQVIQ